MTTSESRTLTENAGFVELNDTFIRLRGSDRLAFFHNFCTADIKSLRPGELKEAFVLNSKGKIIGMVHGLESHDDLLLTGHGDQADVVIGHLEKYLIREDVILSNETRELSSVFVCGELAGEGMRSFVSDLPGMNSAVEGRFDKVAATVWNVEMAGFGYLVVCHPKDLEDLKSALKRSGIPECSREALEIIRIDQKTPWYGVDVDDSNLPQELQRDEQAISFQKGCYLGQETVARIDARGRVNQLLVQLEFPSENCPSPGDDLVHDGKTIGRITSVAFSEQRKAFIALGYVRRDWAKNGTKLGAGTVLK